MNAKGSKKLPPIITGKFEWPWPFQHKSGAQLGFYYWSNVKAWMTTVLYQEWLDDWDVKLQCNRWKIVLFQDNFSVHVPPDDFTNIHIEDFIPNLMAHVQPADAGIIQYFKAHYRASFMNWAINWYDSNISPAQIYDINIVKVMCMANIAWNEVDMTTIHNCWRKTGIFPDTLFDHSFATPTIPISSLLNDNLDNPIEAVEKEVSDSLTHLQRIGVLQPSNWMDLGELLNPVNEHNMYGEGTEEDIFWAVLEQCETEKYREKNVSDGVDDNPDESPKVKPSC